MIKVTLISLFIALSLFAQEESKKRLFDPERDPAEDLKSAISVAGYEQKKIILDVGGDWCIWCRKMDEFINSNKELKEYLESHFVLIKVNFSKENENKEFLGRFPEIKGYPHLFVLDKSGELLHSQDTAELEENKGYSLEKFMAFLTKWAEH